jgi:chromate transporter
MPSPGELALPFALLSLVAFGGGNTTLPEMHRLVVEQHHWLSNGTFSELFALAQAAPGPNILVVSLIGLQLAGISGFLLVTIAFCLPSSLLMYAFANWWQRTGDAAWRGAVQATVGPMAAGLVLASGWSMAVNVSLDGQWSVPLLSAATVGLVLMLPWHPLWWIIAGALLGLGGFL